MKTFKCWAIIALLLCSLSLANAAALTDPYDVGATGMVERGYTDSGFMNGGGDVIFTVSGGLVDLGLKAGARAFGDAWFPNPLGTKQLDVVGDFVSVDVKVNLGLAALGDYTYESGPGLFISDSETGMGLGDSAASDIYYFIGHDQTEDTTGKFRVIAYQDNGNGGYHAATMHSADDVWAFGDWVTLKIEYKGVVVSPKHQYELSYKVGAGSSVVLGTFDTTAKLEFGGPQACYNAYNLGHSGGIPAAVSGWANIDNFYPVSQVLVPAELTNFTAE